jgi:phytoene/squalene synthetase
MATSKDWDRELAKIDKQLESVSDEALMPTKEAKTPAAKAAVKEKQQNTSTVGVMLRLVLAVTLGVGMLFWPYEARCGAGLAAYLGAVAVVVGAGVWTAIWTWRHRTAKAHALSLLLMLWGGVLGSIEVLPRLGYAKPTEAHPAEWACK